MDRDANRTRLIGNCASNRLPNPPRGVSRELVSAAVFEFVYGFHQADVAFLNQVEKLQAAVGVLFRDRNDETQVGFDELTLGLLGIHVSLDDFALGALEGFERDAGIGFDALEIDAAIALLAFVFLLELFGARGFELGV